MTIPTNPFFDRIAEAFAFKAHEAFLISALLILLAAILHHWFALYRYRLKQYNAFVSEYHQILYDELMALPIAVEGLSVRQIVKLRAVQFGRFRWVRSLRIHYASCDYSEKKGRHQLGERYRDPEAVEEAIKNLMKLTLR